MTLLAAALSMLLLGDSISEGQCSDPPCKGYGVTVAEQCSQSRRRYVRLKNVARGGYTSWAWADYHQFMMHAAPALPGPRIAVVMLGTVDAAGSLALITTGENTPTTPEKYEAAMRVIVQQIRHFGRVGRRIPRVWLVSSPPHQNPEWDARLQQYERRLQAICADTRRVSCIDSSQILAPGPTHISNQDHARLGRFVAREMGCR